MSNIRIFILLVGVFLGAAGCLRQDNDISDGPDKQDGRRLILTTIPPLYSFAKNIAGDRAVVENLLPSGVGPHEYSFSPADVMKVRQAHVLIKNGAGLEGWLERLIRSAENERLMEVDTSSDIDLIDNNPHLWLSPERAIQQVRKIASSLAASDPEGGELYRENAERYIMILSALDKEIEKEVNTWVGRKFVAFHPAFLYFARDYGLKQAAVIRESHETEPTPRHLASVMDTVRRNRIKAIFSEPSFSDKLVHSLAEDLDVEVYSLDTMETGQLHREWYEQKVRENLHTMKKALKSFDRTLRAP